MANAKAKVAVSVYSVYNIFLTPNQHGSKITFITVVNVISQLRCQSDTISFHLPQLSTKYYPRNAKYIVYNIVTINSF